MSPIINFGKNLIGQLDGETDQLDSRTDERLVLIGTFNRPARVMSRAYLASAHMHISDPEKWSSPTINQLQLSQLYGISFICLSSNF
jgi:hypothetical protein